MVMSSQSVLNYTDCRAIECRIIKGLMYYYKRDELNVEQGIVMCGYKVVVPFSLRSYVLKELHSSHKGKVKMKSVARSYIWWSNLYSKFG